MIDWILDRLREGIENWGHPDEIKATKISSRLNRLRPDEIGFTPIESTSLFFAKTLVE